VVVVLLRGELHDLLYMRVCVCVLCDVRVDIFRLCDLRFDPSVAAATTRACFLVRV
jgi:hypothetical protein